MKKQTSIDVVNLYSSATYRHRKLLSLPYGLSLNQIQMLGGDDLHSEGFLGNNLATLN